MTESAALPILQDLSAALSGLVAAAAPALVSVHSRRSRASGFIWRPGFVVTADEALHEEGPFGVTLPGGERVDAQVVGRDPSTDVALLRIERSDIPALSLAPAPVAAGSLALVVGSAEGQPNVAFGAVSHSAGPWRSMRGGEIDARIELDLRLRRSAEGGIALDAAGHAIGMAVFGPRRRVLVIPAATIERVAQKLQAHGRVARGYLGLGLQTVAVEGGGTGAMVMSVDPEGPGAACGIQQGDILVAWNGEPIRHVPSLLRALGPESVGQTVAVGLRRAGTAQEVTLTVGERPAA